MADKKSGWGSTVLGWFIVQDGESAPADTVDAVEGQTQSAESSAPAADYFQKEPPPAAGGTVDFEAVFEAAGMDKEERQRVSKAIELLGGLPAGTDPAVKKQIVEASLKAFGVPIEKIIETGAEEIQALEYYIRTGAADTEKLIQESDQRIKEYETEIQSIREIMKTRVQEQQSVIRACNDKKLEVQQILEFFGEAAVARVVKASPKLHDPSEAKVSGK